MSPRYSTVCALWSPLSWRHANLECAMTAKLNLIEAWQTRNGHIVSLGDQLLSIDDLQQFVAAMNWLGYSTSLARMIYDPIHAREQIALAHTVDDNRLRAVAVRLFRGYPPPMCDY